MESIALNPENYEWEVVNEKGKFRGINLTYEGEVNRDEVIRSFASVMRKYGLEPEIRNMSAYISGTPIQIKDTPLKKFEEVYGYKNTKVTYLDLMGKHPSLKAKLLGKVPPYVWLRAGHAKMMEVLISEIDVSTCLKILDDLSERLSLNIPTGFIKSDIDFLRKKKA